MKGEDGILSPETQKQFIHTMKNSYGDITITEQDVDIDGLLKAQRTLDTKLLTGILKAEYDKTISARDKEWIDAIEKCIGKETFPKRFPEDWYTCIYWKDWLTLKSKMTGE
jgi:hypothetical protein